MCCNQGYEGPRAEVIKAFKRFQRIYGIVKDDLETARRLFPHGAVSKRCTASAPNHYTPISPEDFKIKMKAWKTRFSSNGLSTYDGHREGDRLLVKMLTDLGYGEGAWIFDKAEKFYD